jgi:hypothetical protein
MTDQALQGGAAIFWHGCEQPASTVGSLERLEADMTKDCVAFESSRSADLGRYAS